jgi:hypothetical protein
VEDQTAFDFEDRKAKALVSKAAVAANKAADFYLKSKAAPAPVLSPCPFPRRGSNTEVVDVSDSEQPEWTWSFGELKGGKGRGKGRGKGKGIPKKKGKGKGIPKKQYTFMKFGSDFLQQPEDESDSSFWDWSDHEGLEAAEADKVLISQAMLGVMANKIVVHGSPPLVYASTAPSTALSTHQPCPAHASTAQHMPAQPSTCKA